MIAVDEELPWGWGRVYQRGGEEGSRQKKRLREGAWFAEQQVLRLTVPGMESGCGVRHLAAEVGKMRSSRTANTVSKALPSRVLRQLDQLRWLRKLVLTARRSPHVKTQGKQGARWPAAGWEGVTAPGSLRTQHPQGLRLGHGSEWHRSGR